MLRQRQIQCQSLMAAPRLRLCSEEQRAEELLAQKDGAQVEEVREAMRKVDKLRDELADTEALWGVAHTTNRASQIVS